MTVTWFVGNGFDLSVGFKTDYDTFIRTYLDTLLCNAIGCGRYPLLVHWFLVTYNEPVFGLQLVPPLPKSRLKRAKKWLWAQARRLTGARRAA